MSHLYWSCPHMVEEVLRLLAESGREASVRAGTSMPVISISAPDSEALRLTCDLLADERIVSAALTAGPLSEGDLWLATEWWRRVVVERSEASRMAIVLDRVRAEGEYSQRDLVIFRIREKVSPEARDEPSARVREHPRDYYGDFADPLTGGANALYAAGLEAARMRGLPEDRVIVAPPEALGFNLDTGESSVVAWRKKSVIAVEAVGFSLGNTEEVAGLFARHEIKFDGDELQRKAEAWRSKGLSFGVGLVLRGLQDPPVVIPVGSVYQQPSMGSPMQNLAVAQAANTMVAAGATVPVILPAWCLNQSFSSHSGPLAPTPLIVASAGGTQGAMWDTIQSRYRGQP